MLVEDPAPAMAKQGLSGGALDDPDAEESERSDAIARGRVGPLFRSKGTHTVALGGPWADPASRELWTLFTAEW